jgi:hypothetical protein
MGTGCDCNYEKQNMSLVICDDHYFAHWYNILLCNQYL